MKTNYTIRQGDVLLIKTTKKAITAKHVPVAKDEHGRTVLALGEATGHAHVLRDPGVCLLSCEGISDRVLTVEVEALLQHDQGGATFQPTHEHASVSVPPGTWTVRTQREWAGEEVRNVSD